jgi:hypothetical protein
VLRDWLVCNELRTGFTNSSALIDGQRLDVGNGRVKCVARSYIHDLLALDGRLNQLVVRNERILIGSLVLKQLFFDPLGQHIFADRTDDLARVILLGHNPTDRLQPRRRRLVLVVGARLWRARNLLMAAQCTNLVHPLGRGVAGELADLHHGLTYGGRVLSQAVDARWVVKDATRHLAVHSDLATFTHNRLARQAKGALAGAPVPTYGG